MLKLMIVDDERLIREMVRRCVDWDALGLEIVGQAASGQEAMQLLDELQPDIILLDICMPVMDGIAFARAAKQRRPDLKILFLTGHDEFEYANEGIKIGVFDYILKPIDPEELREAMLRAIARIEKERDYAQEYERLRVQMHESKGYIREGLLRALLTEGPTKELLDRLSYFNVSLHPHGVQMAVVQVLYPEGTKPRMEEQKQLLRMRCQELVEEFFREEEQIHVFGDGGLQIAILSNRNENDLSEPCHVLIEMLLRQTPCHFIIGLGRAYQSLVSIKRSHQDAMDSLAYRFLAGINHVISFYDSYPGEGQEGAPEEELLHQFLFLVRSGAQQEADTLLAQMMEALRAQHLSHQQALLFAMRLFMDMATVLQELRVGLNNRENVDMLKNLFACESLEAVHAYLQNHLTWVICNVKREIGDGEKSLIHHVETYLEEHYMEEDISLSAVAKEYFTNPSYLSRVFKQKSGKTFSGYLFQLRMEKAMELFRQSDLRSYEVAEKVGIKDPHYFSVCFKKYVGRSVSEFRKEND